MSDHSSTTSLAVNSLVGAFSGSIDAATGLSPTANLVSSSVTGGVIGALDNLFANEWSWGRFGTSLLTTTAISTATYYLVNGMIHSRGGHAKEHHRHRHDSHNQPQQSWAERSAMPCCDHGISR